MTRRTALTSAAAIAAVVVTGTIAIGANLGLLARQEASAATVAPIEQVAATETIDLFLPVADEVDSASSAADEAPLTEQAFTIDRAGTLIVSFNADGLQVDSVSPTDGWEWETTQSADAEIRVAFTDGEAAIEFVASLNADGSLSATVDELITEYVQDPSVIVEVEVAAPASPAPTSVPTPTWSATAALLAAPDQVVAATQLATSTPSAPVAAAGEPASTSFEHEEDDEYEEHDEYEQEEEHEDEEHEEHEREEEHEDREDGEDD